MVNELTNFIRSLTNFRLTLMTSFFALVLFEWMKGSFDVGNIIAPVLFALLANQFFQNYKRGRQGPRDHFYKVVDATEFENSGRLGKVLLFCRFIFTSFKKEVLAQNEELTRPERAKKILMNNLFALMFVLAVFSWAFKGVHQEFQALAILFWSIAFCILNINEFIKTLSLSRLLMVNIGIGFVLISVSIIAL